MRFFCVQVWEFRGDDEMYLKIDLRGLGLDDLSALSKLFVHRREGGGRGGLATVCPGVGLPACRAVLEAANRLQYTGERVTEAAFEVKTADLNPNELANGLEFVRNIRRNILVAPNNQANVRLNSALSALEAAMSYVAARHYVRGRELERMLEL